MPDVSSKASGGGGEGREEASDCLQTKRKTGVFGLQKDLLEKGRGVALLTGHWLVCSGRWTSRGSKG